MDKYRLVEEKVIGAAGFDCGESSPGAKPKSSMMEDLCVVRITPQAKPRSCITTAMSILVRRFALESLGWDYLIDFLIIVSIDMFFL